MRPEPDPVAAGQESAWRYPRPPRLERATAGLDRLRKKYGRQTVVPASLLGRGTLRGRDGSDGETKPPGE